MRPTREKPPVRAIETFPEPNRAPLLQAMVEGLQDYVTKLEEENRLLKRENAVLRGRVAELEVGLKGAKPVQPEPPPFVKPAVVKKKRPGKPGRRPGHPVALRPPPTVINRTVLVPLKPERDGVCRCPDCETELSDFQDHGRNVEDVVPAKVFTTCYKTRSGYCKKCRHRIESRAVEQPPAGFKGEQKHAQLGLNVLAWAAVLRVENRLPLAQVAEVITQASGLKVCAGALSRQAERLAGWLQGEYEHIQRSLRAADVVYCDETGARVNGRNGYLWGLCSDSHTLYHFDPKREQRIVKALLGATFGGHLVTDYFSAYTKLPYKHQKCLIHLLRDLRETAKKNPVFAAGLFRRRLKRVIKEMLLLKGKKPPEGAKGRLKGKLPAETYAAAVERLSRRLMAAGEAGVASADADDKRLGKRVLNFHAQLVPFLSHDKLQGTNNPAERMMIHAVVARKISGGHRSWTGARAWAVLASITRSARKQGRDTLATVKQLLMDAWAGRPSGLLTPVAATAGPSP
jgi:transposase